MSTLLRRHESAPAKPNAVRLAALVAALFAMVPATARAQNFPLPLPATSPETSSYRVKRVGNLDTAPVMFEGRPLFTVAAPAAGEGNPAPPIVQRVGTIEENLRRIVHGGTQRTFLGVGASRFDAATFKVGIGKENGYQTLYAGDGKHAETDRILTLTESDVALHGISGVQLAETWQLVLQKALAPAILAIQPDYFYLQITRLPLVLLAAAILTWLLVRLRRFLRKRRDKLDAVATEIDPAGTSGALEAKRLRFERTVASAGLLIVAGFVFALWVLVLLWILSIIPSTRVLAGGLSSRIFALVVLWLTLVVIDRVLNVVIVRLSNEWVLHAKADAAGYSRVTLRRPTVAKALENLKSIVLLALGAVGTFSILQISTASAITISALFAFAVSIAAQSIIKDYVNGFLILAEDQFAIGDFITVNATSGVVENLTLRIVQIRTDDGKLVTIPNSTIVAVENATSGWARVDFRVAISLDSDVERATAVLQGVLDELSLDPRWAKTIIEPPRVLGVDSISHAGIVLRAWIKTAPSARSALSREINRRVEAAFRSNRIRIAFPLTVLKEGRLT
jgi:small-conductance mechanosensitive channel